MKPTSQSPSLPPKALLLQELNLTKDLESSRARLTVKLLENLDSIA
jgi:hypothetical protein